MSDENQGSRLPPPAFPPGSRKHVGNNNSSSESLGDGFISPDDPMPERAHTVDDAFISPDEPMPHREAGGADDGFISPDDPIPHRAPVNASHAAVEEEEEGGVVTGMGMDDHMSPEDLMATIDPHVAELVAKVGKLAEALKKKGEAGLRTSPDMDKFESTLRGYCVGYLAGRRADDDPSNKDY